MTFYLQNVTDGHPLVPAYTLATLTAQLTTTGCDLGPTPAVASAGTGCDQHQCVWAQGSGFTTACRVDFHQADGTIYGSMNASCTDTLVTTLIPPEVLGHYTETWIAVVNSAGKWNPGFHIDLR
jgi:hypothetical protein